jgi:hypothetical protein
MTEDATTNGGEQVPAAGNSTEAKEALERRYKEEDLRIKRRALKVSTIALVVSTVALGGLVYTVTLNTRALGNNNLAVRNSVQLGAVTLVTQLDRFFVENKDLYPYFFQGKPAPADDPRVTLAAEYVLDVLDLMKSQGTLYSAQWSNPETWGPWITDLFKMSPVLRQFLQDHPCWYGEEISEVMVASTPGIPARPHCAAPSQQNERGTER